MTELLFIIAGFIIGSLPFSVWIGRYALKKDIRGYGDGNPGATNVIRAGGLTWGGFALMLDITKGALPVGLANYIFHIDGLALVLIAAMPPLGHAFSPFLNFNGGKAIATIFGVWIGLTLVPVPLVGMVMLTYWYLALTVSGWAVMFTMVSVLFHLVLSSASPALFGVWGIHTLLFIYKHRAELMHRPVFRLSPLFRPFFSHVEFDRDPHNSSSDHHRAHHAAQRPHVSETKR